MAKGLRGNKFSDEDKKNSRNCSANALGKEGKKCKNNILAKVTTRRFFVFMNVHKHEDKNVTTELGLHNRYSRNLGENAFEPELEQAEDRDAMVNERVKNFQRRDENYDKVVEELNEMFQNNFEFDEEETVASDY
ncbi:hypothetical protein POCGH01_00068100 [Plasmodium ovale]|uniref:Uncharacterized protein n=1 Tax=Plasmodium ovale TaxID=36330 RepID=A0A1D3JGK5_PLAOA|nr:hypothetical protein POCGH01_00068100 [Plasmodium ovale]